MASWNNYTQLVTLNKFMAWIQLRGVPRKPYSVCPQRGLINPLVHWNLPISDEALLVFKLSHTSWSLQEMLFYKEKIYIIMSKLHPSISFSKVGN